MANTLKVRDRTTNKIRDALVDQEDYDRLKDYKYLTDKNSKEPFREETTDGKRQRISLKRDVMQFKLGDPRRVCYADKSNLFDCRKVNLNTKSDNTKSVKLVKSTATTKTKLRKKVKAVETATATTAATAATTATTAATTTPIVLPDSLEIKRTLVSQISEDKILELIPVDTLLHAWAETNGYERKQA